MFCERDIYTLLWGGLYIFMFFFVFVCSLDVVCPCMVLSVVFKLHAFVILDVHGFGYWKNKTMILRWMTTWTMKIHGMKKVSFLALWSDVDPSVHPPALQLG